MLPRTPASRVISAVPSLCRLFQRALSTTAPSQAGGKRPAKSPMGPSRFGIRASDSGQLRIDEGDGRPGFARDRAGEPGREGRAKLRYVDERRLFSERKKGSRPHRMGDVRQSRNEGRGDERTSRRLADLRSDNNGTDRTWRTDMGAVGSSTSVPPASLSFAKPSSAASVKDAGRERFDHLGLPEHLVRGLADVLGPQGDSAAKSTPIQTLAYRALITDASSRSDGTAGAGKGWVLGAETGSGKTLAYLLPVMHHLKLSEATSSAAFPAHCIRAEAIIDSEAGDQTRGAEKQTPLQPRALVLSPTHELTRQSTSVAKTLSHSVKLRVKGLSSTRWGSVDADGPDPDVLLGTTGSVRKMLGLSREGERWADEINVERDRRDRRERAVWDGEAGLKDEGATEGTRDRFGDRGKRAAMEAGPKLGLDKVEWVVIDEADVLLGPDFAPETRAILSLLPQTTRIILCTATLPPALLQALTVPPLSTHGHGSGFTQLISPGMHRLPPGLKTKFVSDTGGNLAAAVVAEVKKAFEEDNLDVHAHVPSDGNGKGKGTSRAVVFCNSDGRVRQMARKFEEKGLGALVWTSAGVEDGSDQGSKGRLDEELKGKEMDKGPKGRQRGKQGELGAFLSSSTNRPSAAGTSTSTSPTPSSSAKAKSRVLITTSLLSRGLDFSSDISTVILVDPPRDALDFVHRAGRTARAGRKGRVVVFGMGGRGDVRGFQGRGAGAYGRAGGAGKGQGLKGRLGEEVSRVLRRGK